MHNVDINEVILVVLDMSWSASSVYPDASVSLYVYDCLCLCLSLSLSPSIVVQSLCVSLSLFISLSTYISLSPSISLCLSASLCVSLCICLPQCFCLLLSCCLSLSRSLNVLGCFLFLRFEHLFHLFSPKRCIPTRWKTAGFRRMTSSEGLGPVPIAWAET